ncbi:MAG: TetR/AcrR family transcriptional regulator [Pyrinomonadaceae bacterium]
MKKAEEKTSSRMPADQRREQILDAAISEFSENGFRGTTTKRVAEVAGVSEALVFKLFATKEDLYSAILDYKALKTGFDANFIELREAFEAKDDFEVFRGMALRAFRKHRNDTDFLRLLLYSGLESHELSTIFFNSFVVTTYDILSSYIKQRQKDGVFIEIEPRLVVRAFLGMVTHHSLNNTLWKDRQKLLDISDEDAAEGFAKILLNGIKK